MTALFTLFGFGSALLLFLYLLRMKERLGQIVKKAVPGSSPLNETKIKGASINFAGTEIKRRCPVCRMPLEDDEYLVCAMGPDLGQNQKRQAHIYGCKNCFSGA